MAEPQGEFSVGVWLAPQHTSVDELSAAWQEADALGVDSIWLWDHFFPLTGDTDGRHFEAWTLLGALAAQTTRATVGTLVTNYALRNPELLADMARTVDHLSGGRLVLGLGAGWVERDHLEYGYPWLPPGQRVAGLEDAVHRIRARLERLNPKPAGPLPLLIAGDGRQGTLRLAARYADQWNTMAGRFVESSRWLDRWCRRVGRDPGTIHRSCCLVEDRQIDEVGPLVAAGAAEVILQWRAPFNPAPVKRLLAAARG